MRRRGRHRFSASTTETPPTCGGIHPVETARRPGPAAGHGRRALQAVFKVWLAARPESWRQGVEVVAMDECTGFKTATSEELPMPWP